MPFISSINTDAPRSGFRVRAKHLNVPSSSFSSSSSSSKTRKTEDEPVRRVFHTDSSARVDLEPEIIFGYQGSVCPQSSRHRNHVAQHESRRLAGRLVGKQTGGVQPSFCRRRLLSHARS